MIMKALPTVALTGLLMACASTAGEKEMLSIRLEASKQNAGAIAEATLVDRGDATAVTFQISAVPAGVSRPVQLYTFIYSGTCAKLSAEPAYAMNSTTQAMPTDAGWALSREAPVALGALLAEPHALLVRTSPADLNIDIFCGDIRSQ